MNALKKEMATHSNILAWRIPGTEEPRGLPSVGSHRVGHDKRCSSSSKETKELYTENYKTLMKEIKDDTNR